MGLSLVTRASTLRLTTKERVQLEMPSIPAGDLAFVDKLVDNASSAIASYCNRDKAPFARQSYTETLGAYGDIWLMLKATPLVVVTSVLQDGQALTDWVIEDADAGVLYRRQQFFWTSQLNPGYAGRQTFPAFGAPIAGTEEPRFTVNYVAGWLTPAQDLVGKTTISAAAADNSFNDSGNGFPALLQAGDFVTLSGFANAANNGTFTVTGTPAPGKFTVSGGPLVNESAPGGGVTAIFNNMPSDLERAAVETVKAWYLDRQKAPHSRRERVGLLDMEWTDPVNMVTGLPFTAVGLLRTYMRAA
jgi:hypothetical protein